MAFKNNDDEIEVTIRVVNKYPNTTIKELYVAPSESDDWGDELLEDTELETDSYYDIVIYVDPDDDESTWDIKVVDEDDNEIEVTEIDLSDFTDEEEGTLILKEDDDGELEVETESGIDEDDFED